MDRWIVRMRYFLGLIEIKMRKSKKREIFSIQWLDSNHRPKGYESKSLIRAT